MHRSTPYLNKVEAFQSPFVCMHLCDLDINKHVGLHFMMLLFSCCPRNLWFYWTLIQTWQWRFWQNLWIWQQAINILPTDGLEIVTYITWFVYKIGCKSRWHFSNICWSTMNFFFILSSTQVHANKRSLKCFM